MNTPSEKTQDRATHRGERSPTLRVGLVLNKEFHEQNRWVAATTPFLVRGLLDRFDCRWIQSQADYEQELGDLDALVSMEPGWAAPRLAFARTAALRDELARRPSYILYSDPHDQSWREEYFLANGLDFVLAFYWNPTRHHFRRLPEERLVHFPWAVPDEWIGTGPLSHRGQATLTVFGASQHEAYAVRNWCRGFPFVTSATNSGVENKAMTTDEYVRWLAGLDAAIAAGSDDPRYRLTTPKYFEIAAAGALLFAQETDDLDRLGFRHGENCVVFHRGNFESLARAYLARPMDYLRIRRAGRELIRRQHGLSVRLDFLERHIRESLERKQSPNRSRISMCHHPASEPIFTQPSELYLASADRMDRVLANVARLRQEVAPAVETYATVVGGLSGLNYLLALTPRRVIFYDLNPTALDYARFVIEWIGLSSGPRDFISRMFSRSVERFLAETGEAELTVANQDRYLARPVEDAIGNDTVARLTPASRRVWETFVKPHLPGQVLDGVRNCRRLLPCWPANERVPVGAGEACGGDESGRLVPNTNAFFHGQGWLESPAAFARVQQALAGAALRFEPFDLLRRDLRELDAFAGSLVLHVSNIDDWFPAQWTALVQHWESRARQAQCRFAYVSSFSGVHVMRADPHAWAYAAIAPHVSGSVVEVTHKTPWGFHEFERTNVAVSDYLAGVFPADTTILHILHGEGVAPEAARAAYQKALAQSRRVIVLEHNRDSADFAADPPPHYLSETELRRWLLESGNGAKPALTALRRVAGEKDDRRNCLAVIETGVAPAAPKPKPRILFIADEPNWVFERHARTLHEFLEDEFDFTLAFRGQAFSEDDYDLIYPLEWNLVRPGAIRDPARYVTGIRSHCSWRNEDFGAFTKLLSEKFHRVHVVSERLRTLFAGHVPNLVLLTHGVRADFFRATTRSDSSGPGKLRLGWAGNRKSPEKGFAEFIEPLGRLPGVELVFCGFSDRNLSRDDVRTFYDSLDAYVCASATEGNNNSLLEAAAMARAILTTDSGTVPEYLRDGESALIVERELPAFVKAVEKLRDDPALRAKLGAAARHAVAPRWDWRAKVEEFRTFFRQVIAARNGTAAAPGRTDENARRPSAPTVGPEKHLEAGRRAEAPAPLVQGVGQPACPCSTKPVRPAQINIAILTHNALDYTRRCLDSIARHTPVPYNIFILDNQSTDETPRWLAAQTDPNLHYELSTVNLGVPGGRSRQIQIIEPHLPADGFVVFVDNDLEMQDGWAEHFLEEFAGHPEAGIVGKMGHRIIVHADSRELLPAPTLVPTAVDVASGGFACWIRAETVRAVGLFDENLGLFWHEDDDYSVRAIAAGYEVFAVPAAPILHHEHKSGVGVSGLARGGSPENQRYLADKWRKMGWVDARGRIIHPHRTAAPMLRKSRLRRASPNDSPVLGVDARTFYLNDSTSRGIGHYALHHLEVLARLQPDWRFVLLSDKDESNRSVERLMKLPNLRVKLHADIGDEDVDLFHIPDPMNTTHGFDSPMRLLPGTPASVLFHDLTPLRFYWDNWTGTTKDIYRARLDQLERRPCAVLTNSEFTRLDLLKATGIAPDRVHAVLAGLNRAESPVAPDATMVPLVKQKYGITKPFFLHVGALDPHKNFETVIHAMGRVWARHPVQLVVVGEKDHYLKAIAEHAAKMKIKDILFTGFIPRPDLEVLYREAVALLFLSKYEGFGFPVLEAMAQGCPVITSNVTSLPEVAGDAALLFAPTDIAGVSAGMQALLADRTQRESLRANGRAQAAKFTWENTARKTIAVWKHMLGLKLDESEAAAFEAQGVSGLEIRDTADWKSALRPQCQHEIHSVSGGEKVPSEADASIKRGLVWLAPWQNPSGYCSEALAFAQGLAGRVTMELVDVGRVNSPAFVAGLPPKVKQILNEHLRPQVDATGKICVSHIPGSLFEPVPGAAYRIGRTMFETDRLPLEWVTRCNQMHEVWVPSRFHIETFAASGVERDKLVVIPEPADAAFFDPARHEPLPLPNRARCNFLSIFEWSARKGWDVLLAAYLREFSAEEDVCLYLRTYLINQPEEDPSEPIWRLIREHAATLGLAGKKWPRIEVLARQIPTADLPRLYRAVDCLVAPSRGEGWGRPHHEAMLMELPVIATNWSGNTEFMNADNAHLLDFELAEVKDVEPDLLHFRGHRWAEPSEKHLRELMRRVQQDPEEARQKGKRARVAMATHYSPDAVAGVVLKRLAEIERKISMPSLSAAIARPASAETEPPPARAATTVAWDGSFLDLGSLSHVNRELTRALERKVQLTRVGKNTAPSHLAGLPAFRSLARELKAQAPRQTQVTVRHAWPPNWEKPESGAWVLIQPWEYGVLPQEWLRHLEAVDEVWAPSEYVRRVYVESGVDPAKVHVVPNGIDPERFRPDETPLELATTKKFKFLFVGGTIQRKGPDALLQAFLDTFTASDDVCLVIKDFGGKTAYAGQTFEAHIRAAQQKPNAPEILYLTDELPPEQLPSLYTACDCLVHPYRGEGFGLPVLEAMACGLPVIVTGGGATDDFATDEFAYRVPALRAPVGEQVGGMKLAHTGWWLEPVGVTLAAYMQRVCQHRDEARAKGRAASEHVRREWTWERAARIAAHRLRELAARQQAKAEELRARRARKAAPIELPAVAMLGSLADARNLLERKQILPAWNATLGALRVRPFHPEACVLLGEVARVAGDFVKAKQCFDRARRMAPRIKAPKLSQPSGPITQSDWPSLPPTVDVGRLSVCLITRNEEKFIGRCLESVRRIAHQIVVLDTGSTDRTVEIAKEHGAETHSFAWTDDFSAARNACLAHATGDWILVLDADEELPASSHKSLREEIQDGGAMAYRLPIVDVGNEAEGQSYVPRLFRNAPALFYVGRIHEQVFSSLEVRRAEWGLENRFSKATILHHGYTDAVARQRNKNARNLKLLERAIEEMPNEPNLLMNHGLELVRAGRLQAGIEQYMEAFQVMSEQRAAEIVPELRETLLTQLATHLMAAKDFEGILAVLTSPLARQGGLTASMHFAMGLAHMELKQFTAAAEQFRQCLRKRNDPVLSPVNKDVRNAGPHHCLAGCLRQLKQYAAAEESYRAALTADPQSRPVRFDYAILLHEQGQSVDALQRLMELASEKSDDALVWRVGGTIALSRPEFLEFARDWTGEAIKCIPKDRVVRQQRAEALLVSGLAAEAMPFWQQLPVSPSQAAALALCELAVSGKCSSKITAPEPTVSREFLNWYRRLVDAGAQETLLRVHERIEAMRAGLPTAAGLIETVLAEARQPAAT